MEYADLPAMEDPDDRSSGDEGYESDMTVESVTLAKNTVLLRTRVQKINKIFRKRCFKG